MGSLKEFLAEQAEDLRNELSKAEIKRDEWIAAVDRINAQIRDWIAQADETAVLTIEERTIAIREEMIGAYKIRGLTISLGIRSVRVQPIARYVMSPLQELGYSRARNQVFGRVDLTNGLDKYKIYREARWCPRAIALCFCPLPRKSQSRLSIAWDSPPPAPLFKGGIGGVNPPCLQLWIQKPPGNGGIMIRDTTPSRAMALGHHPRLRSPRNPGSSPLKMDMIFRSSTRNLSKPYFKDCSNDDP